jgi:hypothetical protein
MYFRNAGIHSSSDTQSQPRRFGSSDECLFVFLAKNGSSRHVTSPKSLITRRLLSEPRQYFHIRGWMQPHFSYTFRRTSLKRNSAGDIKSTKISLWLQCSRPEMWSCLMMLFFTVLIFKTYLPDIYSIIFCPVTNKCTIISQIITLLHVSTLSFHPQTACNPNLAK